MTIQPVPHPIEARTVALVCLGGPMFSEQTQQAGVIERARMRRTTLFLLSGTMLENPQGYENQRNVIFDLVDHQRMDGLILNSDYLGHIIGPERVNEFTNRYQPLPMVNIGAPIPGIPTLAVDFYQGMYDLIAHLIEVHRFERIAFIKGSEKSYSGNERYRAYQDALRDHGIPFDENLVAPGTFYPPSGQEAIRLFFDQRQLRPGRDIQAIAAINDFTALDAMLVLQDRGYHLPDDLAVTGFDDEEEAFSSNPPLTTAHLPTFEIGEHQVDMLLAMIAGERVPDVTSMPAPLVVRQSCGCVNPTILQAAAGLEKPRRQGKPLPRVQARREEILDEVAKVTGSQANDTVQGRMAGFLDLLLEELEGRPGEWSIPDFAVRLEQYFTGIRGLVRYTYIWHAALSVIRREILPSLGEKRMRDRFEDLCQQARASIADISQRTLVRNKNQGTYLDKLLQEINQEMATALSVDELMEILASDLPRLGIRSCYLSFYEDPQDPVSWARLRLAYQENTRLDIGPDGLRFPATELIPRELFDPSRAHILVCLPLYFRVEQIGFVLFEAGPSYGPLYEALRESISSTLKRIQLHQEAEKARGQAEEANRLKSSFLSIVSHELRTPLSLITNLSELLLQEKNQAENGFMPPYQHELAVIHATGQHLDRLLRDVLDLGRSQLGQLKLECERVDFAEVVREAAPVGEELAREKGLKWSLDLPSELPQVWGDRTRLRQVLLNLISNACKFTTRGDVSLRVVRQGEILAISVSDTGLGIPRNEQDTIFDEFHQTERTTARGFGGMGLGLAITRRLVEMHGGTIRVHSTGQEGAGATFTFQLPVMAPPGKDQPEEAVPAEWSDAVLILTQRLESSLPLRRYLEERGFKVKEIQVDAQGEWLDWVVDAKPGALVLDCEPASGWGVGLVKMLKERSDTRELAILFACLPDQSECGSVLEFDFLTKPMNPGSLLQALERLGLEPGSQPGRPITVLVVDDEPAFLELHTRLVRERFPNSKVLEARNGQQALEVLQVVRPDLVLLDLLMPELDGFGVLEKMRSMESTRDVPVVVLTAQTLTQEVVERLNRGVAAILGKGLFNRQETLAQVEAALARSKRLGSEAQRIARRGMIYLHDHYAGPVSREAMARAIGVNERYLTRCFRQETGVTPMEYLSRYRVKQAKQLLAQGEKSITEVALECGFSSSAYFSRVFRLETGLTPHEYRQGKREPAE